MIGRKVDFISRYTKTTSRRWKNKRQWEASCNLKYFKIRNKVKIIKETNKIYTDKIL